MAVLLCSVDWYPDGKTLALTTRSRERREYLETLFESLLWETATMAVFECRDEAGTNFDSRLVVVGCVHTSFLHIAMNVHSCLSSCAEVVFRFSLRRTFASAQLSCCTLLSASLAYSFVHLSVCRLSSFKNTFSCLIVNAHRGET